MKIFLFALCLWDSLFACGIAFVQMRKPLSSYEDEKSGLYKLMVLMDRERNRGQDGAGIAVGSGKEIWIDRDLSLDLLLERCAQKEAGRTLLGHLRYGTSGGNEIAQCHPIQHLSEDPEKTFVFAGNFNLTNCSELLGIDAKLSDTFAMLKTLSQTAGASLFETLKNAAGQWDGGYVVCLMNPKGEALLCRDPAGIRPGYYFFNEEVFAAASERFALMDAFGAEESEVRPIPPGHAISLGSDGSIDIRPFAVPSAERSCVFERIYFSKANDSDIYRERKALGRELGERVFEAIEGDLAHTVFTYVPNSSQSAFLGLVDEIDRLHRNRIAEKTDLKEISSLLSQRVRSELLILKNQKVRTFISPEAVRRKWVSQLYEVTQNVIEPTDTIVVVDDSIVRGVTLKEALISKLISLNPKKIIFVSSAPPVCYPDCYGIDMSQLGRFIAFQAAAALFEEKQGRQPGTLAEVYSASTLDEISRKVAALITPEKTCWKGTVQVIYQSLEGLHKAIPASSGDWVFSGNYPTPGGHQVLNRSFTNWLRRDDSRSY